MKFGLKEFIFFSIQFCFSVSQQCANLNQCNCSLSLNVFQVICDESNSIIYQQDILSFGTTFIDTIIINNLNLESFPNLCLFDKLQKIDLSRNQIASNITGSIFSCLFELNHLNLSSNKIRFIDENAFDFNSRLRNLDLSFNRIEKIPLFLFKYKLKSLQHLYLQGNFLKEIDVWFFYLKQIKTVDLRFNNISEFKNEDNFRIDNEMIYSTLAQSTLIDLRNNMIEGFNDDILKLYNVCNETSYLFFIRLLYSLRIDQNPLKCNCTTSFNFINFFITLTLKNFLNTENNIFNAKCTNFEYNGRSIFNFATLNNNQDCLVDFAFSNANCPLIVSTSTLQMTTATATTTTTSANVFLIPQNLLNEPDKNLNETDLSFFNDAQIAGYIIGLFGFAFLFIFLIYFLCPIEILAICFDCVPFFYSICPCKSRVKRQKEFDLFISYNRINEDWVLKKLVPFINEKNLVENFILHYDSSNTSNQVFGKYIKDKMNRSSCILFILSDAFLIKEWNNEEFRQHLRYLITQENTRFVVIQMHDICDEEVDEYFTDNLQISSFISMENEEFFFWKKLSYFLYTNKNIRSVQPIKSIDYIARPNDEINFEPHSINRPIIHMPEENSKNIISKIESRFSKSRAYEKTKKNKKTKKNTNLSKEKFMIEAPFSAQENIYEINRIKNDYLNEEKTHLYNDKKYRQLDLNDLDQSTQEEYVDSLIITK